MYRVNSRYYVPSFVERTSDGTTESNPYSKLFEERIVFVGSPIDEVAANDVSAQLLSLEGLDPDRDIEVYINSPGGSLTAMAAVYDTMKYIRPQVRTVCLGQAVSAAALLLAAGQPGKRSMVENARISISQPSVEGVQADASDLSIYADEIARLRRFMENAFAAETGTDATKIRADLDRELILSAEEAADYGLVDSIVQSRKLRR